MSLSTFPTLADEEMEAFLPHYPVVLDRLASPSTSWEYLRLLREYPATFPTPGESA